MEVDEIRRLSDASMRTIILIFIVIACLTVEGRAQKQSAPANEVHQLYLEDQSDRSPSEAERKVRAEDLNWDVISRRDAGRRSRVHELLRAGELHSAEDFHDAAFIYQHGTKPEDYLLAHILATVAVQKGDEKSLWISAATLDRYLQSIGQPQVFGTQYNSHGDSPVTQDPYNRGLIPDQFRAVFCVPDIEHQKENIKVFNTGKYPEGIIPPGCTR